MIVFQINDKKKKEAEDKKRAADAEEKAKQEAKEAERKQAKREAERAAAKAAEDAKKLKAEAEAKVAEQTSISEEQRVILANKSQVIIGLQYQISQVKSELSESKKNAQRLSIQVKTLNELLENVRKISGNSQENPLIIFGKSYRTYTNPNKLLGKCEDRRIRTTP